MADVVEEVAAVTSEQVVLGAAADRSIPPANTKVRADDSEDTLITGRTASTAPTAEPEDEARYNPRPPHRRRYVRPLAGLVVVVLLAAVALGSAYAWTRTQYFVGVAQERVAIYQGLSDSLPGLKLSHVYEVQPLAVVDLPPYYQEKVKANIEVQSLSSARQTVGELAEAAQRCVTGPSSKATASALPSRSPTRSPATPSARPTGTPNPSQPAAPRSSAAPYPADAC